MYKQFDKVHFRFARSNVSFQMNIMTLFLQVTALPNIRSGTEPYLVLELFTPAKQYGPRKYSMKSIKQVHLRDSCAIKSLKNVGML